MKDHETTTQMFAFAANDPKTEALLCAAIGIFSDGEEGSVADASLYLLSAAVKLLTFLGHSPESIAQIVKPMHEGYIKTYGPSGNTASFEKVTRMKGR